MKGPSIDGRGEWIVEAFVALNDLVFIRLTERGHGVVQPAHAAVLQYLDDTGATVSLLAERTQMTKQAIAELVGYLESTATSRAMPGFRSLHSEVH